MGLLKSWIPSLEVHLEVGVAGVAVPLPVIQRQLGHSYASTTSVYLQGIDVEDIIGTIHARRAPTMHVSAGLDL